MCMYKSQQTDINRNNKCNHSLLKREKKCEDVGIIIIKSLMNLAKLITNKQQIVHTFEQTNKQTNNT